MKRLVSANRRLAELKGVALTIPNETILISTLTLQEARESSLVENIVTTQDDLYRTDAELKSFSNASAKEVLNYRTAIQRGFDLVRKNHILPQFGIRIVHKKVGSLTNILYLYR